MNEKAIAIAAKLYEARRTLQALLRENYHERMRPWIEQIGRLDDGRGPLKTGMRIVEQMTHKNVDGLARVYVLAAIVEILEPTEAVR